MQLARRTESAPVTRLSPDDRHHEVNLHMQRTDEELVIAAQSGESRALDELLGRHRNMLYGFVRRYTANPDDAQDLVQEALFRAFINIGKFRGESRFTTWLHSIAFNEALMNKRREKRVRWIYFDEEKEEGERNCMRNLPDTRQTPEEDYADRELRILLRKEARKLPARYGSVLQASDFCDLDHCSMKDAARSLGVRLGTFKTRLHRARKQLSAAIQKSRVAGPRTSRLHPPSGNSFRVRNSYGGTDICVG